MNSAINTTRVLAGVASVLLLAGAVALGFAWGSAGPPAENGTADQEMEGMADPGAMDEMDDMEAMDMAMGGEAGIRIARPVAGALGVTTVAAQEGALRRRIRATGHVDYDETRLTGINPRVGGWVEELHVDFTGRQVSRGEPLLEIYSPELVSAQEELLSAHRLEESLAESRAPGVSERSGRLVASARERLRQWDISEEQIREIEESGEVRRTLTLHAPRSGFVVEKDVREGGRVEAGSDLYQLADLSAVWLEVDLHEQDLRFARRGERVEVQVDAYPDNRREGVVSYVYPDVKRDTRTGRARVEMPNDDPERMIKPGMFATAYLEAEVSESAVTVPRDAVMFTGDGTLVFVEQAPGMYEMRDVRVGATADERTEILEGLEEGEPVVARAGFIVDAESRLMEAMMGQPDMPGMEMDMDMDNGR